MRHEKVTLYDQIKVIYQETETFPVVEEQICVKKREYTMVTVRRRSRRMQDQYISGFIQ